MTRCMAKTPHLVAGKVRRCGRKVAHQGDHQSGLGNGDTTFWGDLKPGADAEALKRRAAELLSQPCPTCIGSNSICATCEGTGRVFPWQQTCSIDPWYKEHCVCCAARKLGISWIPGIRQPDGSIRDIHMEDVVAAITNRTWIIYPPGTSPSKIEKWEATCRNRGYGAGDTPLEAALAALIQSTLKSSGR